MVEVIQFARTAPFDVTGLNEGVEKRSLPRDDLLSNGRACSGPNWQTSRPRNAQAEAVWDMASPIETLSSLAFAVQKPLQLMRSTGAVDSYEGQTPIASEVASFGCTRRPGPTG